ncbi:MAG: hypothetical protein IPG80_02955 [Anaerolineales bacterium]|jgi:hypothetical protein|uniref:hypothetical protein n=1 Tax=Candidatus Villigracilis vicinus TaxID=3140679 RepID=UPI0031371104|nr:hypothetical protein [Anaerolineales bacterium]MBK7451236.1 hypothetical protein [Anaerolineales bacterium]MBK9779474.1 hypothetical protein [Anaerolineales bacterium]
MPGLFDRLDKEIKESQKDGGISPLDIAKLPPSLRKIMRVMLRELQMSYPRMCEVMDTMPEQDRLTRTELDSALSNLTEQFWLTRIGEREKAIYKVNLRRKEGSTLAAGIWSSLDSKLKRKPPTG